MNDLFKIMPADQYHAHPALSNSQLKWIAKSPAHFQSCLKEPPKQTPDMWFGSLVHLACLEREEFEARYVCNPGYKRNTKEGKADFEKWAAENPGKEVVDADDWQKCLAMREAFDRHDMVRGAMKDALIERCAFWKDPETGVDCRARFDILASDGVLYDFKTASDVSPWSFGKTVHDLRYHVQAAFYLSGLSYLAGLSGGKIPASRFVLIVMEKSKPFGIRFYDIGGDELKKGFEIMRRDLDTYARCLESGEWPNYPETIESIKLPSYAY